METYLMMKPTNSTPWGKAQHIEIVAEGIVEYMTAGHGGIRVYAWRVKTMPEALKIKYPFAGAGWYEEDCDWCIPFLAFPDEYKAHYAGTDKYEKLKGAAEATLRQYHPEMAAAFFKVQMVEKAKSEGKL